MTRKKRVWMAGVGITLMLAFSFIHHFRMKPPEIFTSNITLAYGEPFTVEKVDTSEDVVSKQILAGDIQPSELGWHELTIRAVNRRGVTNEKTIRLEVVDDEPPRIDIEEEIKWEAGEEFDLNEHLTVTDNVDGEMTASASVSEYDPTQLGTHPITITAKDEVGNESTKRVQLTVEDTKAPNIFAEDTTIKTGGGFDPKRVVSVIDGYEGDITDEVKVHGKVDVKKAGHYPITYAASDASGNEATKTIVVTVESKWPRWTKPMHLYIGKASFPYVHAGRDKAEEIIETPGQFATYGGEVVFSGKDKKNTTFIANGLELHTAEQAKTITVTDENGKRFSYKVSDVYDVHDNLIRYEDGKEMAQRIVGSSGGERITILIQHGDNVNTVIEAKR